MRYRVELDELLAFADRLQAFERRAEAIATQVDERVARLHATWSGAASNAHRAQHDEWMASASQMGEALAQLRDAAHGAHRNYTDAAQRNLDMLT
ncbi:WXG100 family type VII secretion target [Mycolicibacterium sp. 050158]|jgi:WXG100 family type VII secretion target|uniref:WXG100 family type VII secretion target n=1 Tax=Mycolicibacterium sp. 050158 TaxID=3090602 RepID=UPI00299F37B7|nr:WXG100 family type VII secretion target [Mycolicibacterium sp. 050158]MDX1888124.1 WXG100 family type VII secretion target [Mycolicibacterium sp. 050158]